MWTPKYENGCLIMLKYALEPLYAPEPLCDCLHQVVTIEYCGTASSECGTFQAQEIIRTGPLSPCLYNQMSFS